MPSCTFLITRYPNILIAKVRLIGIELAFFARCTEEFTLGDPETTPHEERYSIMRKTVHEWLEANHNGTGMAKKKAARLKSSKRRAITNSQIAQSSKKQQASENKASKRPK